MEQRDRAKDDTNLVVDIGGLDPNGGVLVSTTYWRPRPGDPNPEQPGEKLSILSYLPTDADDLCPCDSGKPFGACCQPLPYWRPVCPNPGMQGFSLMHLQVARFTNIPTNIVHDFLQEDERLYCVEDTPRRSFWIFWGDPALDAQYGTLCFGDFELRKNRTLVITALSDVRMEVLLELVRPLELGTPQMQLDPFQHLMKPVQKASEKKRRRKS
jgi:SEC-C motif-containing protein